MGKVDVKCPFCQRHIWLKKYGLGCTGHQRFRCQNCC
ncbi:IS1 family transposase [Providencia rettgeri]|nr:IS1 family transposase [Providencia rettgeri]